MKYHIYSIRIALILLFLLSASLYSQVADWKELNSPLPASVTSIEAAENNNDIIATNSARDKFWISSDKGESWSTVPSSSSINKKSLLVTLSARVEALAKQKTRLLTIPELLEDANKIAIASDNTLFAISKQNRIVAIPANANT